MEHVRRYWRCCYGPCVWILPVAWVFVVWPAMPLAQVEVERRLGNLETIQAATRLAVIETRLDSIEGLGRGLLIGVGVQLLISGLHFKRASTRRVRKHDREDDE